MGFRKADNRLGVMGKGLLAILLMVGLTACGGGGSSTPAAPAPTINVTASSANIAAGQPVTLTWTTTGATSVDLAEQVSASSVSAQDGKVRLIAVSGPNSCALYADPNYVHTEERQTTDEGRETGGLSAAYAVDLNGSKTVSPSKTTVYKFTATGAGGTTTTQVTVYISTVVYNGDQLIKEYQIDDSFSTIPNVNPAWKATKRWDNGYIDVYDETNSTVLQNALDDWNAVLGTVILRKSANPNSPVKISLKSDMPDGVAGEALWGYANVFVGNYDNYRVISGQLYIRPSFINWKAIYVHELGHMLGFYKHTVNDGVMDAVTKFSSSITPLVYTMMHRLYELPVMTVIP